MGEGYVNCLTTIDGFSYSVVERREFRYRHRSLNLKVKFTYCLDYFLI